MKLTLTKTVNVLSCLVASGCSVTPLNPDNHPVRIIFHNELPGLAKTKLADCDYIGTVVSSEGHWYDYIYISNTNLVTGSINKMHNLASAMGANLVYIDSNVDFKTSVTFVGQAYHCDVITNR